MDEDQASSSSSSGLDDVSEGDDTDEGGDDDDDEDGSLADQSLPSDAILHDPNHRLAFHPFHRTHNGPSVSSTTGRPVHRAAAAIMGTSYMSYVSNETTSQGGGASPYGMSPCDGSMLERNPLGTSPPAGAVPMSLGTPDVKGRYMAQVPLRIGRR